MEFTRFDALVQGRLDLPLVAVPEADFLDFLDFVARRGLRVGE